MDMRASSRLYDFQTDPLSSQLAEDGLIKNASYANSLSIDMGPSHRSHILDVFLMARYFLEWWLSQCFLR